MTTLVFHNAYFYEVLNKLDLSSTYILLTYRPSPDNCVGYPQSPSLNDTHSHNESCHFVASRFRNLDYFKSIILLFYVI